MVPTGIVFETTTATRVLIKVNDVPFKYVQLQHFPLEHLTANGYTSYYLKWVTKTISGTSKLCVYFKKCHPCVELWVQTAMQSILLGMNVDSKNSTIEACKKIPPGPRNYSYGAPFKISVIGFHTKRNLAHTEWMAVCCAAEGDRLCTGFSIASSMLRFLPASSYFTLPPAFSLRMWLRSQLPTLLIAFSVLLHLIFLCLRKEK